jgi:tRNA (cytosine40_48-C5)-methyltransferase
MLEPLRVPPSPALRRWSEAHGFSPELVARWGAFYGDLPELLRAMREPAPTHVRLNPLRGDPRETRRRLEEKGFRLEESGVPGTLRVAEAPFSAGATEEYLLGRYYLQDPSSALAPLALEPRPGERIADLCAAPGAKTVGLAALAGDRAALFAFDADTDRARGLQSTLQRCGVAGAAVYARPAQDAEQLGLTFDRILLDAPCTGEGVVQRDPGRRRGQLNEYATCARDQADLLGVAHRLLRPGGTLVYSTCTLAPEENELQVQEAVDRLGFRIEPLPDAVRNVRFRGQPLRPGLTRVLERDLAPEIAQAAHALPHPHGTMGFFLARLRKGAAA